MGRRDVTGPVRDFLRARDHKALAFLQGLNEQGSVHQSFVRSGIEPGRTPAHHADIELFALQIRAVDIGDFKFAALRRLEPRGNFDHLPIVKIKSRNRVARFRTLRFFFNAERLALRIELNHAVPLRVIHGISENAGALGLESRVAQFSDEIVTVENVVAEHQCAPAGAYKFLADQKRLRDTLRLRLRCVLKVDTEPRAIAEQVLKARQILGRRDEQNFPDAGQHQC